MTIADLLRAADENVAVGEHFLESELGGHPPAWPGQVGRVPRTWIVKTAHVGKSGERPSA